MNYIFIGAHPDDPDLYMGATPVKLAAMGHKVKFVAMCNGDAGHYSMTREALAARRYGESRAAAKLMGLCDYEVFNTHDCCVQRDFDASKLSWEQKRDHLGQWLDRFRVVADAARNVLVETYGDNGRTVRFAETFEQTQYGRKVSPANFRRLSAGIAPVTSEDPETLV